MDDVFGEDNQTREHQTGDSIAAPSGNTYG